MKPSAVLFVPVVPLDNVLLPTAVLLNPVVPFVNALYPTAVLYEALFAFNAPAPRAVHCIDLLFTAPVSALNPTAVLFVPVDPFCNAFAPSAVLFEPVNPFCIALYPTAVLLLPQLFCNDPLPIDVLLRILYKFISVLDMVNALYPTEVL